MLNRVLKPRPRGPWALSPKGWRLSKRSRFTTVQEASPIRPRGRERRALWGPPMPTDAQGTWLCGSRYGREFAAGETRGIAVVGGGAVEDGTGWQRYWGGRVAARPGGQPLLVRAGRIDTNRSRSSSARERGPRFSSTRRSNTSYRRGFRIGAHLPAYCSATGRVTAHPFSDKDVLERLGRSGGRCGCRPPEPLQSRRYRLTKSDPSLEGLCGSIATKELGRWDSAHWRSPCWHRREIIAA